jgi:UDP-N-acetylmuramate: L-alanyl-gamma-D-glutamyl-meso-diaminopimelate ligase
MTWNHSDRHNAMNAMAAVAASVAAGVDVTTALNALSTFGGVKRRMEKLAEISGIHVYDDFAHHPTAIRLTLEGLRKRVGNDRILVALEPRSNTMRAGVHADELGPALIAADSVWLRAGAGIDWDPNVALAPLDGRGKMVVRTADMLEQLLDQAKPGDHVVFMSNGGFESAQHRFCTALNQRARD